MGNNLTSWLLGSNTKSRELRETMRAWEAVEALHHKTPLAESNLVDLVVPILTDASERAGRSPARPVVLAAADAVFGLLDLEPIGTINPVWPVIENSTDGAIEFREMMARRRRWCADYPNVYRVFRRVTTDLLTTFYKALPEPCFSEWDTEQPDVFEVPLVELLDDPAALIDQLFALPHEEPAYSIDLFERLRLLGNHNLLRASGLAPDTDASIVRRRMLRPSQQTDKTAAELADLYLAGSPLRALVDLPVPFHIPDEARFEHCHIVGGTGHGKTQLMQKMIHADLVASQQDFRSVIVIDSQGDLINKLVRLDLFSPSAPDSLADRLVLIDPSDVEFPAALNLFDAHLDRVRDYSAADRERVLNGVIELYELFFGAFLGAELTQKQGVIFKYLARLMLAIPNATIHTLMRIMEDGKPFKPYMEQLDGSARYFFETEFFHPSFAATKKQVLRRLWGVLSTPAFERMFTQPKNKLDIFEAMNEGKIILVSTAKDLLKREGSQLLGRFFIAMITQAALERQTLPERRRNAAFVYVDEAQEYFDDSIETILNQARKYHVGLTLAHQTLDQLSPRLRSAILSNTSMKCAGGVSAKDARALADELRTTSDFIEGMKRRGQRSEFAVWVKHLTGQAIRLSVPLGFLERQPTLDEEDYDALVSANRERYCGALVEIPKHLPSAPAPEPTAPATARETPIETQSVDEVDLSPEAKVAPVPKKVDRTPPSTDARTESPEKRTKQPVVEERELGKGGKQHRYLQSLVKELAEQNGLKATIEAPLARGSGQVDVLIERNGVLAAIEISVTTPVQHECENLRKCLSCDYPRIAVVLVKSKTVQMSYRTALREVVSDSDRERVSFLTPEEIPDFIAALAPPPESEERVVRGYKVKGSFVKVSPEDARARQEAVARLIAKSIAEQSKLR